MHFIVNRIFSVIVLFSFSIDRENLKKIINLIAYKDSNCDEYFTFLLVVHLIACTLICICKTYIRQTLSLSLRYASNNPLKIKCKDQN